MSSNAIEQITINTKMHLAKGAIREYRKDGLIFKLDFGIKATLAWWLPGREKGYSCGSAQMLNLKVSACT